MRAQGTADRERGLTLIELLVAISLFAIVSTLITTLVITVAQTHAREESQQDSTNGASLGMQHITRIVRAGTEIPQSSTWQTAPAFSVAQPRAMTLQSYLDVESTDEGPTRVALTIDTATGQVTERRFAPRKSGGIWVYDATPTSTRVLVRDVTASSAFTFLRADGSTLPSRTLTESERREIAAVRVDLAVQTHATDDAAPTALRAEVSLPNLDLTRTGSTP
jgi:prepilin-type N-terminal cleavage/methylation domain-containing protein